MKTKMKRFFALAVLGILCIYSISAQAPVDLDAAIRQAGNEIGSNLVLLAPRVALVNISSPTEELSLYILRELALVLENRGNSRRMSRQDIDRALADMNIRASAELSDEQVRQVGRRLDADIVVTGLLERTGETYRLRTRSIIVSNGTVLVTSTLNVRESPHLQQLLEIVPVIAVEPPPAPAPAPAPAPVPQASNVQPAPVTVQPTAPVQVPESSDRPGLYANGAYQGNMDLLDAVDWIKINAINGGNYIIIIGRDERIPFIDLNYDNMQVGISLKSAGAERSIRYVIDRPSRSLLNVWPGVTFILEDGVSLVGLSNNSRPMVRVEGGTFIMNGGNIRDNSVSGGSDVRGGGGVLVSSGTFIMNGGTIRDNSVSGDNGGGGVYFSGDSFTMNNGNISGNSSISGGGVYVARGMFTMNGGTISGNSSRWYGGGVYVGVNGTFIKSGTGGVIFGSHEPAGQANRNGDDDGHAIWASGITSRRNTTVRISQPIDSRQRGTAGGWE